jgi:ADP-heptose:LPS heptosyltransferase
LIVRTDRIGDVILTFPMAQALRRLYPEARIAMLVRNYTAPLVKDHPSVDEHLLYDDNGEEKSFFRMVAEIRRARFDLVFHTYPRPRAAFMTFLAGIPVRVGTGYRWYSWLFNRRVYEHRKDARRHELEYNLNLLQAVGAKADPAEFRPTMAVDERSAERARAVLDSVGIDPQTSLVLLHPGSGGSARDWPWRRFGELAARLKELPATRVVVTGGRGEDRLVADVLAVAGEGVAGLVDRLDLRAFAALVQRASLFVANSTGPIHIAAAVGTPVIGFYPQVTPLGAERWGPYTDRRTIFTPAGRSPRCTDCVGGATEICACMDTIDVERVFAAAVETLRQSHRVSAHA